jgi:hypothetical protein
MNWYQTIALGFGGGALPDVLRIIAARHGDAPPYLRKPFFYVSLGLLCILGGLVCLVFQPDRTIDALALGYSAPAILSKLLSNENPPPVLGVGNPTTIGFGIPNPFAPLQEWWAR